MYDKEYIQEFIYRVPHDPRTNLVLFKECITVYKECTQCTVMLYKGLMMSGPCEGQVL